MRIHLSLSAEDYAQTQDGLRELVSLRNNLVHHFIDQHDLWTLGGCREAHEALAAAYARIDQHFERLRGWAEHMDQARRLAAEFVQPDTFRDLVIHDIAPADSVDWPAAGIVRALREASVELAEAGHPLPAQDDGSHNGIPSSSLPGTAVPVGGRCLHESRLFEPRLFELSYRDVDGQRAAWYRARAHCRSRGAASAAFPVLLSSHQAIPIPRG